MRRGAVVALVLAASACAHGAARVTLPAGSRVLARGSLAYAVAFTADARLVSIELEERFALKVRSPDGRLLARHDLGPAERDLPALALDGDVAWVGGADREVRGLALGDGAMIARWPIGAEVTALAAAAGMLLVGDADGAVCARRLADGALLHCVQLALPDGGDDRAERADRADRADRAIDELSAVGHVVVARAGALRWSLSLPSLAIVAGTSTSAPVVRRAGRDVYIEGARAVRLAGPVKAVALGPQGRIAVAAWIARLDDPSVILLPPRRGD